MRHNMNEGPKPPEPIQRVSIGNKVVVIPHNSDKKSNRKNVVGKVLGEYGTYALVQLKYYKECFTHGEMKVITQ